MLDSTAAHNRGLPSFLYAHPSGGRLYVSGRHFKAWMLDTLAIDAVLSAVEPPTFVAERNCLSLRCLFDDAPGIVPYAALLATTTQAIVDHVTAGGSALVHCAGGYNRGPFLAGLILRGLGLSGEAAVELILARHRRDALTNESLARMLMGRPVRDDERRRPHHRS